LTGFVTAPLRREHERGAFRSGVDALDRYFKEFALQDIKRRMAGCFVALDDAGVVAGFYTLAATSVAFDSLPAELTKRLPRYPVIPAMLLGRLAVATECRGRGLGRALVADALMRTDGFGIGAFALIVDVKDARAAAFYQGLGFASIPDDARRMFLPIATALQVFKPSEKS
jgi:ribosomal protein S18 acetylase RimI-like enzyme